MSRIGKKPVQIPDGVTVTTEGGIVTVSGPKGTLKQEINSCVSLEVADGVLTCTIKNPEDKQQCAYWGLTRSLVQNMVIGVTEGYKKSVEIHGVGYKFDIQGKKLVLSVGYSHKIEKDIDTFYYEALKKAISENVNVKAIKVKWCEDGSCLFDKFIPIVI